MARNSFISLLSLSLSLASIHLIPPCPPSARKHRRQLLQGYSLRCISPSPSSRVPSLVSVLGRRVLATGSLPGVHLAVHRSRAVALTVTGVKLIA